LIKEVKKMLRKLRGQSTAEYAIVIGLVIGAAVAMQVYVKRGIQAKVRDAVDFVDADDNITTSGAQYEPYYLTSDLASTRAGTTQAQTTTGGGVTRSIVGQETSTRTGTTTIEAAP